MEGDLIANIKKIDTDKIDYVVMGTSVTDWDAVVGSNSGDVIGIWLLFYAYPRS
jgi:hypothetical protein